MAKDVLQRFVFEKIPIRGEMIRLQESFKTIIHQHTYPQPLRQLLGEALCAAGLLSAIIKFEGRLTLQFRGKGKLKLLLAQCDNFLHLRGLAKWDGELSHADLIESFQDGVLAIMLDAGPGKNTYQGVVAWRGESLAESLEGYFANSEQLATRIWLTADEHAAAGYLLQILPATKKQTTSQEILDQERNAIYPHWERVTQLTQVLTSEKLLKSEAEILLPKLYPEEEIRLFPGMPVSFRCSCSRKRGEDAILVLGRAEAEAELKDKQTIVVTCDFCNEEYIFDRADIEKIFIANTPPPDKIH